MPETPAERSRRLKARIPIEEIGWFDLEDHLVALFALTNRDKLIDLTQLLLDYSMRDQEEEASTDLSERRREGHRLALEMKTRAAGMIESLEAIYAAFNRFNDQVVRWHPPLLEAIFDVDTAEPGNVFTPDQIEIMVSFFAAPVFWETADAMLQRLADLPVRKTLKRGPVENTTLRRAVAACRDYWRNDEGRSWTMSSLKTEQARKSDLPAAKVLQGECELFVHDVMAGSGLRFTYAELAAAWAAVDRALKASARDANGNR